MCKEFLVRSRVGRWFILMISFLLSSASLAQTNVTTNAGDQSAGSLGWAVTTLNNAGAGSISIDGGVGPITLTQPLASVSQSVTFQGANSSVVGQDNGQAQFNFQQGFALDTGAAMTLTNNGGNSLGLDSTMTAGTMTFSSGSNLSLDGGSGLSGAPAGSVFATFGASTAASGSQFDISGGLGFTSGSSNGGNAGSATVSILSLNLTGSNGVVAGGAGGDGPGGAGRGGDVSFSAGSVSLSGSGASLNLTGGNGGNLTGSLPGPSNGGNGGNVGVTVGFIEADSQADVTVRGGQGGDSFAGGNGPGGTGGSLLFNMGSVTLTSSSTMSLLGGDGGDSGGVAGASGGAGGGVNLLLNNLTLTGGSTFIAGGGTGGSGTGQGGTGGNTSFFVVNLSLDAGSLVEAYGGDAGAGGSATGGTVNSLIGDLEGAGTVSFGTGAIGLQINSGNFSGVLEGDEYLYKVYPGDLTLSGANSYTGGTTINGGTIFIDTGGSLGTGGIQANQGGTLDYLNNSIAGPNTITLVAGGGTLDFHNNSSAGNAVIDDGSYLTFADNSTAANASVTVENTGWAHFLGGAQGGNAHFTVNGTLDISGSSSGITLGALEGSGLVSLGGFNLGVGADGSSAIFSGVISDSGFAGGAGGSLTKLGTGTLALAGANNYSGGTSIIAGTLAISGNGSLGAGNVWNDSDLVYVNGSTASSPLIVNNSHLDFFDSSSAGDSSITNNSSLTFNDTATAGMAVVTTSGGATVSFAGLSDGGTAQFIVNYGGYFDLSGHSAAPMTVGSIEGDGSFELGANNLTTGSNNLSTTLFGTLSDGGSSGGIGGSLTKIGMGTLTLIGSNFYTGYTSIEAGTLAVGDPHALGAGSVTVNGGTLAITGGPLMLDVGGNYTQTQSGTLQLGVASGLIDSVNVTGAAALGGTLDVSAYLSGVAPVRGQSTTVITAATITGAFQNGGEGAPGIRFLNVYGLTDMALLSIIPSFQELGTTANQKTIGIDLDSIVFNSSMAGLMSQLGVLSDADFRTAENQISPEGLAAIYMAGFEGASSRAGLVGERLSQLMDKVDNSFWMPGFADSGSWYASAPTSAKTDAMASSKTGPWGGFISGNGGFFNVASDSNALGYKASAYGLTGAGADYRLSHEASVGLLVGYGHTDVTLGGGGNLSADGGELGLYGLLYKGGFYGSVLAEGGINSYSSQRFSYNGTASGKTQGTQYDGALEVGYAFKKDKAEIGPFGSLQYAHVGFDGFTEQGSQAALTLPAQGQDSVLGQFGLKSGGYIPMGSQTLHPSVRLAWEHEFNYQGGSIQAGFGQGDSFKVLGSKVGQDGIRVGASVGMELTKEFSVNLNYQGELARANLDSHQFGAGASLGF